MIPGCVFLRRRRGLLGLGVGVLPLYRVFAQNRKQIAKALAPVRRTLAEKANRLAQLQVRRKRRRRRRKKRKKRRKKRKKRKRAERENFDTGKCESQEIGDRHHLDSPVMSAILVR